MEVLLPVFESLVAKDLEFKYTDPSIWISLLTLLVMVSVIGGLYPAFILSHFRPADILKANYSIENQGSIRLRNLLVVFQFGISIALIIATSVIYIQVKYSLNRDPGFNRENLLIVNNLQNREVSPNRITLKQQVERLPDVINTSLSGHQPMQRWGDSTHSFPFTLAGDSSGKHPMSMLFVDHDFFQTYQIRLLVGRDFDKNRDVSSGFPYQRVSEQERQRKAVINTSAARTLGFTNPEDAIGKTISANSYVGQIHQFSIIGVVADTQFFTLRNEGRAEVYIVTDDRINVLTVRYRGSSQAILTQVTAIWNSMMGDVPIATNYVDQNMTQEFFEEQMQAELLIGFSLLAIIIACLGLYGSTAFTVDRRIKEIGLRKVMGAKVKNIVSLLLWQFSKPVLIANIIAWPVAIFAMQRWLDRFPYRFNPFLMIPICLVSGLIALAIAWFTVAGNTTRVAKSKPIKALRYE
jgi:putative ABC transport system permease protein